MVLNGRHNLTVGSEWAQWDETRCGRDVVLSNGKPRDRFFDTPKRPRSLHRHTRTVSVFFVSAVFEDWGSGFRVRFSGLRFRKKAHAFLPNLLRKQIQFETNCVILSVKFAIRASTELYHGSKTTPTIAKSWFTGVPRS